MMNKSVGRDVENSVGYPVFEQLLKERFKVKSAGKKLFRINPISDDLWLAYLDNLEGSERQQFNCNCCKSFIRKYGDLAIISEDGKIESILWSLENVPKYFRNAVQDLKIAVETGEVKEVFFSDEATLGSPFSGGYGHLNVKLSPSQVNVSSFKQAHQLAAEKDQEFRMLKTAVANFDIETVEKGIALLKTGTIYRGEQFLDNLEWFKKVVLNKQTNSLWKAVAEAPVGFARVKNNVVGTLLEDIVSGYTNQQIATRLSNKLDPAQYMRSQSAPTIGNIEQAERLVKQYGLEDSLRRRYAKMSEIPEYIWENKAHSKSEERTGLFASITPKVTKQQFDVDDSLPMATMTWDKFSRTVLPNVSSMSAKMDNHNRLMSLVTEAVEGSENIMKWNNPFSWYYHGGADAEMRRRVESAGGRYENNDIRVSLMWNTYTDLDLHCQISSIGGTSFGHIYYGNKRSEGGYLDVDMNVSPTTREPVENIRFVNAEVRRYEFYVNNYTNRDDHNSYVAELEVNGKVYRISDTVGRFGDIPLFTFEYNGDGTISNLKTGSSTVTSSKLWNANDEFINVKAIVKSPNVWGDNESDFGHTFFLLDDIKDESEGAGRGFFNEMLRGDLHEIRKTLESYAAQTRIEGIEEADTFGLGFKDNSDWDLILKVVEGKVARLIKIDRFD